MWFRLVYRTRFNKVVSHTFSGNDNSLKEIYERYGIQPADIIQLEERKTSDDSQERGWAIRRH
jgi:hypothetical protein